MEDGRWKMEDGRWKIDAREETQKRSRLGVHPFIEDRQGRFRVARPCAEYRSGREATRGRAMRIQMAKNLQRPAGGLTYTARGPE